jgi:hypothetical protein
LCGREIEIRRAGDGWDGTHVAVRPRNAVGTTRFAAIFGSLAAGRYEFRLCGDGRPEPALAVRVTEASVALADWPQSVGTQRGPITEECPG